MHTAPTATPPQIEAAVPTLAQTATHLKYITWALERFARADCTAELAAHHYPNMDLPKFSQRNHADFAALKTLFDTLQTSGIIPPTLQLSLVVTELGDTGAVIFTDTTRLKTA